MTNYLTHRDGLTKADWSLLNRKDFENDPEDLSQEELSQRRRQSKKTWCSKLCSESRVAIGRPMFTGWPSWRIGNSAPRIRSVVSRIGAVFIFPVDSAATRKM
jgi:hypothetical protein